MLFDHLNVLERRTEVLSVFINYVFALKRAKMNQNFLFFDFFLHFQSALAILELQIYVVVEQFVAENIPLLSGRLVLGLVKHTVVGRENDVCEQSD